MSETTKVEFAVKIKGSECVEKIKNKLIDHAKLSESSINSVIDDNEARIIVDSNKPWVELHEIIESCGLNSALVGFSDQSAVGIIDKGNTTDVKGVIRFCSIPNKKGIVIDGVVDGLAKSKDHFVSVYEYGDISNGCENLGEIYNNATYNIKSNDDGRSTIRTIDNNLSIPELIGRGVCISNSNEKLACGIISRSAGIFQNYKRICVCSGKVLWDERDLQNMVRS
ncbi:copper chaperone for superoxide dismutase-like [Chironomus tepperi]|uniref:copper chaperone for superoxide dismutase-like n=1 Tax=Chironomus tepperi TaxID=113505 RepID=UPI00391F6053